MATRGPGMPGSRHPTRHVTPHHPVTGGLSTATTVLITLLSWRPPDLRRPLSARQRYVTGLSTAITGPGITTVIVALLLTATA